VEGSSSLYGTAEVFFCKNILEIFLKYMDLKKVKNKK